MLIPALTASPIKDTCASKIIPIKIVHSSAMHYQNLNTSIIHKPSKKLLTMKSFFVKKTPSTLIQFQSYLFIISQLKVSFQFLIFKQSSYMVFTS